jgi:hypothetical protein
MLPREEMVQAPRLAIEGVKMGPSTWKETGMTTETTVPVVVFSVIFPL